MKYIGEELENFSIARFWRCYVMSKVNYLLKDKKILEVGAGTGSFSELIVKNSQHLTVLEPDENFAEFLREKFTDNQKIKVVNGSINKLENELFDAIIHFQVLEHIEDDNKELLENLSFLKNKGYLIICVPSFMSLYSNFDKSIGHFRRYEKKDFKKFDLGAAKIEKIFYLDSIGYLLYRLFKIFINSDKPNKTMIFIWDRIFIPLSFMLDKIVLHKFGKNLMVIIKKN